MLEKKNAYKQWMRDYKDNDNKFGRFAREILSDENFPSSKRYMINFEYLTSQNACDAAIDVFRETWIEYEECYGERD